MRKRCNDMEEGNILDAIKVIISVSVSPSCGGRLVRLNSDMPDDWSICIENCSLSGTGWGMLLICPLKTEISQLIGVLYNSLRQIRRFSKISSTEGKNP